jgi:hypothetical protein
MFVKDDGSNGESLRQLGQAQIALAVRLFRRHELQQLW